MGNFIQKIETSKFWKDRAFLHSILCEFFRLFFLMKIVFFRIIFILMCVTLVFSSALELKSQDRLGVMEEAYQALKIFNYFKAREVFLKNKATFPFLASYGLSVICRRNDNPFSNLDSAYHYLEVAEISLLKKNKSQRERSKDILRKWHFQTSLKRLANRSDTIVLKIYHRIISKKGITPEGVDFFLKKYHRASPYLRLRAHRFRDSLAFGLAFQDHTALAMRQFITHYPMAVQFDTAQHLYQKWLYLEKTASKTPESYRRFALMYPESHYADSAYHKLFLVSTPHKTPEEYYQYAKSNPQTPYAKIAWRLLYGKYFTDYSSDEIDAFLSEYPEYPFADELEKDKDIFQKTLFLSHKQGLYGFVDTLGNEVVPFEYRFARDFHQGLALASMDQRVGYIDKKGLFRIPMRYDEGERVDKGFIIVDSAFHLGVIDLSDKTILPFHFEKITRLSSGLFLTQRLSDQHYQLFNDKGIEVSEAYPFATGLKNGYTIIGKDGKKGLIDPQAKQAIPLSYQDITPLSELSSNRFYRVKKDRKWGVISAKEEILIPMKYDYIGPLSGGRILFVQGKKKYGYFDHQGKKVIRAKFRVYKGYQQDANFEVFAKVRNSKGNYGLIDKRGKKIFPSIFQKIASVSALPIPVKRKGKWGFVDKRLKMLVHRYGKLSPFKEGVASGLRKGKYELLRKVPLKKGFAIERQFPKTYDHLMWCKGKLWIFGQQSLYGVLEAGQKKVLIPAKYSKIEVYPEDQDVLRLYSGDDIDYYRISTSRYICQSTQIK